MLISLFFVTFFCIILTVILVKLLPDKFGPGILIGMGILWLSFFAVTCVVPFFATIPGYSDGCRTAYVEKISKKGVFFKTWEGQSILMGYGKSQDNAMVRETWSFSVESPQVAEQISKLQGKLVKLCYEQNYVTKFSTGSSDYIIRSVELVE